MKLLIDIGNTATKFALYDKELNFLGRIYNSELTELTVYEILINVKQVDKIYVSSVAPYVAERIHKIMLTMFNLNPIYVNSKFNSDVDIQIDNKEELGADLLCDIVAAKHIYGPKTAVIDFGTATKILFIDENGVFNSCAIFLGYMKSKRVLAGSTELLPEVNNIKVKPISECHNTNDVINSSAYYSQIFTVKGLIKKYEDEVGYKVKTIITGGNSIDFLQELGKENYDELLLMKGLGILSERN